MRAGNRVGTQLGNVLRKRRNDVWTRDEVGQRSRRLDCRQTMGIERMTSGGGAVRLVIENHLAHGAVVIISRTLLSYYIRLDRFYARRRGRSLSQSRLYVMLLMSCDKNIIRLTRTLFFLLLFKYFQSENFAKQIG